MGFADHDWNDNKSGRYPGLELNPTEGQANGNRSCCEHEVIRIR
jgi:hypothetical protein